MSGSFWKFGQDYSAESPLSKLLNRAFVKVHDEQEEINEEDTDEGIKAKSTDVKEGDDLETTNHDQEETNKDSLPDTESEYKDYKPNLEVLDELLNDEELYTELMCSNFKLLIFFKYPEVLSKLVEYVTNEHVLEETLEDGSEEEDQSPKETKTEEKTENQTEEDEPLPDSVSESSTETSIQLPPESEEQAESRRARIAAEILSADVWPISSAFMDHEDLLVKLWAMLSHPSPLSIVASTYFMKINERLLDMDIAGMLHFILDQNDLVDRFLTHIDNPPLMDFLLKVISTDKPDTPTGVIDLLKGQQLIPKLLDHLSPNHSSSTQSAAGDFLKALITISANSNNEIASAIGPNELTRQLVSAPMMEKLVKLMLCGGTSLSNGVGIVIELIRKNNSDYDFVQVMYTTLDTHPPNDRDPIFLGHLVKCFSKHLPEFNKILVDTELSPLETPFGTIEPLGFERFKICELIAELLHCSNMTLLNEPNGEEIVRERDVERERILKLEREQNYDDKPEDQNVNTSEEEEMTDKLNDLRIETNESSSGGSSGDESATANNEGENNGTDIHSEDSSDSELTEKSLRENPVVGDQLKIALQDNEVITMILKMFFKFPWNNFLHNVVFDIVQQIFNGPLKTGYNRFLLADLFMGAHITHMIIEGDKKCEDYENETGLRLGYMGHLTLIAEEVAKFAAYVEEMKINFSNSAIWDSLNEESWKEYTETILADTREKYSTVLGDFGDEEDDDHDEIDDDEEAGAKDIVLEGTDMSSYHDFENDQGDGEDYAEYNDVDNSRYYEYEDGQGNKTKLHLNPDVDYDIVMGNRSESEQTEAHDQKSAEQDDNKFSNYMSHQLTKDYAASSSSDDDEEDDSWNVSHASNFQPQLQTESTNAANLNGYPEKSMFQPHQFELQDDDDDYMDPNDDGQSYAKPNHPLYSNMLSQSHPNNHLYFDQKDVDLVEDDSDDSDDESNVSRESTGEEISNEDEDEDEDDGYSLCRTSSKDNMTWDSTEQNRIIGMANFNRQHQEHHESEE